MGYDIDRFEGHVDEEFICQICSDVLQEPLLVSQCEHAFCSVCINEWFKRQHSCPVDRKPITENELKQVPRILRNLLSCLLIRCRNVSFGCSVVTALERLQVHEEECEHDPKRTVPCERGCGLVIPRDELKDHNCVYEVKAMLQSQQQKINEMQSAINENMREIGLLKSHMQDCITRLPNSSVPTVAEPLEQEDTIRWTNSLERTDLTPLEFFGIMGITTRLEKRLIHRYLSESGCPSHLVSKLLLNAYERRWPLGINNFDNRRSNSTYFESYVFKKLPGDGVVRPVIVMAVDNPHMNRDMIMEPGFIMLIHCGFS